MSVSCRRAIHITAVALATLFASLELVAGQAPKQASAGQAPSEANFFIGTPAGWKRPTTAWGDPDLQGTWPISYVGSVPFERCAGGGGRGRGGTPASLRSAESVPDRRRVQGARRGGGRPRRSLRRRHQGWRLRQRVPVRHRRSDGAAAADLAHRRPAERAAAGHDGRRQAPVLAHEEQLGASRRTAGVRFGARFRHVGSLHHARHARVDVSVPVQQRRADYPIAGLRGPQHGDDPRGARDSDRRAARAFVRRQAVAGRFARTLGRARPS